MRKPVVLIIDDKRGPRESLRMILKDHYEVLLAAGPEEGLQLAQQHRPDVVFCDIRMPQMEGPEVLRRLKEMDPAVQVALITAYAGLETAQQAVRLGALDYITKPFSVDEILQVAQRGVKQRQEILHKESLLKQLEPTAQILSGQLGQLSAPDGAADQQTVYHNLAQAHSSLETQIHTIARLSAIGEVAAEVAHDVRNFLTAILLRIEILLMEMKEPGRVDADMIKAALQDIVRAATEGAEAAKRISSAAKADPYKEFVPLDVNEIAREVANILRGQFSEAQNTRLELQLQETPLISGSASALRTALLNVVLNARQALPETGGQVTLSTGMSGEEVFIRVQDTGKGIPEEILPHVTEAFFTTKGEQGSGLGLSIVRKVVTYHDGRLEIDSELDVGTTVTMYFPVARATPVTLETEGRSTDTADFSGEKEPERLAVPSLLIVDDEPETLKSLSAFVASLGYDYEAVRRGREALEKIEYYVRHFHQAPRIVLIDLYLPDILGTELAQRVRALAPHARLILISAYITNQPSQIVCPYVNHVLKKPLDVEELRQLLQG